MEHKVGIKRAYDPASDADGFRVYIDRLWPRGMSHETFHYDLWDKEIAPSTELREWFHASPGANWSRFCERYKAELESTPYYASFLKAVAEKPKVTLLYSSRDRAHNNAVVLGEMLEERGWSIESGCQLGLDSCSD